jgi:hypothetical protein
MAEIVQCYGLHLLKGDYECSRCGEVPSIADTRWRWNGETWEHKCGDAQAGHFVAVKKESEGEK